MLWAEGLDSFGLPARNFTGTNDGKVAFAAGDLVLMNRADEFRLGTGDADAQVPVVTDPPAMIVPGLEELRKIVPECLLGAYQGTSYFTRPRMFRRGGQGDCVKGYRGHRAFCCNSCPAGHWQ